MCGGGYQVQRRYCTNPVPKNYGKPCYGRDYNRRFCNVQKCSGNMSRFVSTMSFWLGWILTSCF